MERKYVYTIIAQVEKRLVIDEDNYEDVGDVMSSIELVGPFSMDELEEAQACLEKLEEYAMDELP